MRSISICLETSGFARRTRFFRVLGAALVLMLCVVAFPRAASLRAAPLVEEGIDYLLVFDRCYSSKTEVKKVTGRLRKGLKKLAAADRVAVVSFDCHHLEGTLEWSSSRADSEVALRQVTKLKPRKGKAVERAVAWVRFSEEGAAAPFFPVGTTTSAAPLVRLGVEFERAIRALAEPNRRQTAILIAGSLPAGGIMIPENYAQVLAGEAEAQGLRADLWQPLVSTARELNFSLHSLSLRQVRVAVDLTGYRATSAPVGVDRETPPDEYGGMRIAPESARNSPESVVASSTNKYPGNGSPLKAKRRLNEPPPLHSPRLRLATGSQSLKTQLSQKELQDKLLGFLSAGGAGQFYQPVDLPDLWSTVARYEQQRSQPEEAAPATAWARFLASLLASEPMGGELAMEIQQVEGKPVQVTLGLPRGLVSTDSAAGTFGEKLDVYLATSGEQDSLAVFPGAALTVRGKFAGGEDTVNLPLWLGLPGSARRLAIAVRNSRGEYRFGVVDLSSALAR